MPVAAAVPRQEHQPLRPEPAEQQLVGRLAERRFDGAPLRLCQAVDLIDAAAADHADHRLASSLAHLPTSLTAPNRQD